MSRPLGTYRGVRYNNQAEDTALRQSGRKNGKRQGVNMQLKAMRLEAGISRREADRILGRLRAHPDGPTLEAWHAGVEAHKLGAAFLEYAA